MELAGDVLHPLGVDDLLADRARIAGGDLEHQGTGTGHRSCPICTVWTSTVETARSVNGYPTKPGLGGANPAMRTARARRAATPQDRQRLRSRLRVRRR